MKKLTVFLLAMLSSSAFASTVAIGGAPASRIGVKAASGGALLTGENAFYITVGSYASPPVVSDMLSFAAAIADFNAYSTTSGQVITNGSVVAGTLSGSFVGTQGSSGADLSSSPVYMFISNTSDYTLATEFAVVQATTAVFPNPVSGSGSVAITPSVANLTQAVGVITDEATGTDYVTMVAIPEPSVALLGALGVFGLVRRRR